MDTTATSSRLLAHDVTASTRPRLRRCVATSLVFFIVVTGFTGGCGRDTSGLHSGVKSQATGGQVAQAGSTVAGADAGKSSVGGSTSAGSNTGGVVATAAGNGGVASVPNTSGGAAGVPSVGGTSAGGLGAAAGNGPALGGSGGNAGTSGAAGSSVAVAGAAGTAASPIFEVVDVGLTWSGQPTEMSLNTVGNQQFLAYWGADKRMTVASRILGEKSWKIVGLPPVVGDDGHHSIVMAADKAGYLHLSGRMHNEPLTYLRSTSPMDIMSFKLQMNMLGTPTEKAQEASCTYPQFFIGPIGDLVFAYRSGASGQGDTIINSYDAASTTWTRLLGSLLIDGQGVNSAYIVGPKKGPDGYWHLVWTWRVSAACETNHDLSYARTKDFVHWETGTGAALTLPITLATADIVDAVPVNGGMINNNTKVGFDSLNRPVIVYHKFDSSGATQLYNARVEDGKWVAHQSTSWTSRWAFSGYNTIAFKIEVDGVRPYPNGQLKQLYYNANEGNGGWGGLVLNQTTLIATEAINPPYPYPSELGKVESTYAGMRPRWAADAGTGPDPDIYYMMRWETLEPNGDQARIPEPPPTTLRIYGFRRSVMTQLN